MARTRAAAGAANGAAHGQNSTAKKSRGTRKTAKSEKSGKVKDEPEKPEAIEDHVKEEEGEAGHAALSASPKTPLKKVKRENHHDEEVKQEEEEEVKTARSTPQQSKKQKHLATYGQSPFPDHPRPTAEEAHQVLEALQKYHNHYPKRPEKLVDSNSIGASCGAVNDPMDALIRTILSQNTSNGNSRRAKENLDEIFGQGNYEAIRTAPFEKLAGALQTGGLANVKSKVIQKILNSVHEAQGKCDLAYLHKLPNEEVMRELMAFDGVGPKTASCVMLFCMGRESFAVDTHVYRLSKMLKWVPAKADRDQTHAHLDTRIMDDDKYALHILMIEHGKKCCGANGRGSKDENRKCPLIPFKK